MNGLATGETEQVFFLLEDSGLLPKGARRDVGALSKIGEEEKKIYLHSVNARSDMLYCTLLRLPMFERFLWLLMEHKYILFKLYIRLRY